MLNIYLSALSNNHKLPNHLSIVDFAGSGLVEYQHKKIVLNVGHIMSIEY